MRPWDGPPSEGPWLPAGKNSRAIHCNVKAVVFREIHTLSAECGPSQKARGGPEIWGG